MTRFKHLAANTIALPRGQSNVDGGAQPSLRHNGVVPRGAAPALGPDVDVGPPMAAGVGHAFQHDVHRVVVPANVLHVHGPLRVLEDARHDVPGHVVLEVHVLEALALAALVPLVPTGARRAEADAADAASCSNDLRHVAPQRVTGDHDPKARLLEVLHHARHSHQRDRRRQSHDDLREVVADVGGRIQARALDRKHRHGLPRAGVPHVDRVRKADRVAREVRLLLALCDVPVPKVDNRVVAALSRWIQKTSLVGQVVHVVRHLRQHGQRALGGVVLLYVHRVDIPACRGHHLDAHRVPPPGDARLGQTAQILRGHRRGDGGDGSDRAARRVLGAVVAALGAQGQADGLDVVCAVEVLAVVALPRLSPVASRKVARALRAGAVAVPPH
eukprot:CAMPEP_0175655266 /NCGR_PEP_ID=MMETSP0097-20121207/11812_1 /TAXON_ID=311494 /ORGANISM="Alexandrium monilatum, Strain CCMP3105" /LENGTH=387 /DNA_ID=CAMNT_0016961317 /DNA_START=97 /DNA_END=1259 /DNA_ORIENTATION=-